MSKKLPTAGLSPNAKPKPDLKTAPGLIFVRLQLTQADHASLRRMAADSEHKNMAILARHLVTTGLRQWEKKNGK